MTPLFPLTYTTGRLREKCLSFAQAPPLGSDESGSEVRTVEPWKVWGWREKFQGMRHPWASLTLLLFQHFLMPRIAYGCLLTFHLRLFLEEFYSSLPAFLNDNLNFY